MTVFRGGVGRFAVLLAVPLLALLAGIAGPAMADTGHAFDPSLSLEGNCIGKDGAQDPDCPYQAPPDGPESFKAPCGVAVDPRGDVFVSSPAEETANGRIDVFDSAGKFLVEIRNKKEPCDLAVDSHGVLYVVERGHEGFFGPRHVDRYEPSSYPLAAGVEYSKTSAFEYTPKTGSDLCAIPNSVAVDRSNDHLYIGHECRIEEFGSVTEGNPPLKCCIGEGATLNMNAMDVYGRNHDVYASRFKVEAAPAAVFVFDGTDGHTKCKLDGSDTPNGDFDFGNGGAITIDQANGDLYVYDVLRGVIDRYVNNGEECPQFSEHDPVFPEVPKIFPENVALALDAPCRTGPVLGQPCSAGEKYESPNAGYVYVTIGTTASNSHLYAFGPDIEGPPEIRSQSATEVGETEAVLRAELNPHGINTEYRFEYTTQESFENSGYTSASRVPVPDSVMPKGGAFVPVVEPITGLAPGVAYRFRLVASNSECPVESPSAGEGVPCGVGEDVGFSTYPSPPSPGTCANEALRTGPSSTLPDCRAYELVSPANTDGHIPTMAMLGEGFGGTGFDTRLASPTGESVIFGSTSGALPGIGGGGFKDTYEALRDPVEGWQTSFDGVSGAQAEQPRPGGISDNHAYAFWNVRGSGSLNSLLADDEANYLRVPAGALHSPNCLPATEPNGRFEWIGCGSLGFEPRSPGGWIGPQGQVIFSTSHNNGATALRLEPCAPPTGISAVYERTPGGQTTCVSLLPDDAAPEIDSRFLGASSDGNAVAFAVGSTIYVRRDGTETVGVTTGGDFGGISAEGDRVVYVKGGDIFVCELAAGGCLGEGAHTPVQIGSGGESTLVNVSGDGTHAFFVSKVKLSEEENGHGATALAGAQNLYAWDGASVHFIASLDTLDVSGEEGFGGLGLWVSDTFNPGTTTGPANDPSRVTPDGTVFVFESRADLTGYDSHGHREVYRYDESVTPSEQLSCLSCNPSGASPVADAQLESKAPISIAQLVPPVNSLSHIDNVTVDGASVFFQSGDRLVAADLDGKIDVYEWAAREVGGCNKEGGCLSLISSGHSNSDNYLYATTPDGHDIFFLSSDALVPADTGDLPSIYDARVEGGFPVAGGSPGKCVEEGCQPSSPAPTETNPASAVFEGPENPPGNKKPRCTKNHRHGARCTKGHRKRKSHRRHGRRGKAKRVAER